MPATNPPDQKLRRQAGFGFETRAERVREQTTQVVDTVPDRFKEWWAEAGAMLPEDFELAV